VKVMDLQKAFLRMLVLLGFDESKQQLLLLF